MRKQPMKLCKDCAHYRESIAIVGFQQCARAEWTDPVNGGKRFTSCEVERMSYTKDSCGPEGHYWEPIKMEVGVHDRPDP